MAVERNNKSRQNTRGSQSRERSRKVLNKASKRTRSVASNRTEKRGIQKRGTQKRGNSRLASAPVPSWRYQLTAVIFGVVFLAMIARAVFLAVVDNDYLQSQGDARYLRVQKAPPTRGMILDRNDQPIAVSTPVSSIWVHPQTILSQKDEYAYKKLSQLVGLSRSEILRRCEQKKDRQFVYLKRHLSPALANKILALDIPGVNSVREYKRYYPAGPVFGHVVGFTNIDNVGQEGLELAYNNTLKGRAGRTRVLQDKVGHVVEYVEQLTPVEHGEDVKLSIDARIQYLAYRYLTAAVKKHKASSASLVALHAKTGEILAMVNAPDFNPNDRSQLKSAHFRNRALTDLFEPGSTVKPFTVAMALDESVIKPDTLIDTEPGHYYIGRSRINDTKNHGVITVSDVIRKSSNIGSAKVALMMPPRDLYDTYRALGFGQLNNLKLQGEQKGILAKRANWRPIEHATLSYGYGLSVSALQLARAYTALANNGELLPISLHPVNERVKGKRVFSEQTATQVTAMMESVVSDGTAPKAQVYQYRVAGKTGTAHRVENGQYLDDSYVSLFAGFAPASDPEIVMAVVVNDPKGVDYYGGLVAAPVFSNVMNGALRFMDVAPDNFKDEVDTPELMITRPQTETLSAEGDVNG